MIDSVDPSSASLPNRDGAPRCSSMDTTRRCVLPPEHEGDKFARNPSLEQFAHCAGLTVSLEGDHVYPPQQPLSSQVDIT